MRCYIISSKLNQAFSMLSAPVVSNPPSIGTPTSLSVLRLYPHITNLYSDPLVLWMVGGQQTMTELSLPSDEKQRMSGSEGALRTRLYRSEASVVVLLG